MIPNKQFEDQSGKTPRGTTSSGPKMPEHLLSSYMDQNRLLYTPDELKEAVTKRKFRTNEESNVPTDESNSNAEIQNLTERMQSTSLDVEPHDQKDITKATELAKEFAIGKVYMTRRQALIREKILEGTSSYHAPLLQSNYKEGERITAMPFSKMQSMNRKQRCKYDALPVYRSVHRVTHVDVRDVEHNYEVAVNSGVMKANAISFFSSRKLASYHYKQREMRRRIKDEKEKKAKTSHATPDQANANADTTFSQRFNSELEQDLEKTATRRQSLRANLLSGTTASQERNETTCPLLDVRDFKTSQTQSVHKCVLKLGKHTEIRNGLVLLTIPGSHTTSLLAKLGISHIFLNAELEKPAIVRELCACGFLLITHNPIVLEWDVPCLSMCWSDPNVMQKYLQRSGLKGNYLFRKMQSKRGTSIFEFCDSRYMLSDFLSVCHSTLSEICGISNACITEHGDSYDSVDFPND